METTEEYQRKLALMAELLKDVDDAVHEYETGYITSEDMVSRCLESILQKSRAGLAPDLLTPA